jgi:hypothetical protein
MTGSEVAALVHLFLGLAALVGVVLTYVVIEDL